LRGSLAAASSAIRSAAMLAANSGWPDAKTFSCLTSSSAISSRSNNAVRTCAGEMVDKVMGSLTACGRTLVPNRSESHRTRLARMARGNSIETADE
jgi:hypothetical protein